MGTVLTIDKLNKLSESKKTKCKLVLIGGCFDILHAGHLEFIKKARALGDTLVLLLESDENVRLMKGNKRPVNKQITRAKILSSIKSIDYIICLPFFRTDNDYEKLVIKLEPDIIAVTHGTKIFDWEKEYVKMGQGKIIEVMEKKKNYSTSKILESIKII